MKYDFIPFSIRVAVAPYWNVNPEEEPPPRLGVLVAVAPYWNVNLKDL